MAATISLHHIIAPAPDYLIPINSTDSKPIPKHTSPSVSFKSCKSMDDIKQLYSHITKQGQSHSLPVMNSLLTACSQMGTIESLDYARKALELFEEDEGICGSLFMYNTLIRGLSAAGFGDDAVLLYVHMVVRGIMPDKYTFPFVLSACSKAAALDEGVQIHGAVIKMGLEVDMYIRNSLIHFYAESGKIDYARKVFDAMHARNVVSWTSLMCGYARGGYPEEAVSLFYQMVEAGIEPSSVTMVCVISACAKLCDLELCEKMCNYIKEHGVKINTLMWNALVDMYMKCGAVDTAKRLFDECRHKNLVLYNTVMSNYVRQGLAKEARDVLDEMLRKGLEPDRVTMLSAISAAAELGDLHFGRCCHGYVLRKRLEGWDSICNAIIDMYMKCGQAESACKVFDGMSYKTVVSWNSLIAGFIRNGDVEVAWGMFNDMPESDLVSWNTVISALIQQSMFEEALELFHVMQCEGIRADRVTLVGIACACGNLGALDLAKWIYAYIERNEIPCDMQLSTALVDMFARCGDPQSAIKVFSSMSKKDVSAWTAAIGAMAMEGNAKQAIEFFEEMLGQGVKPDGVVFVRLLMACSHAGLVKKGWQIFNTMKEVHGISPQIIHYGCMVDLLGRAGLLDEAFDLIKNMPMEPNNVIWGSLLAACRTHKNVEMATYAAEQITEMDPHKTGIHVLLSNIYAAAGKWNDVSKVRLHIKERGLKKEPGTSTIEVDGTIHQFTSGDGAHPERNYIDLMLHEMNSRLKVAGHIPELSNVLLDVDEQEKEYLLSRHSEKLAIAFGLINTSPGIPIRVVKNLRICSDCHAFAKVASQIYNREIIIRDNNRFHFFQKGVCSCGGYW